MRSRRDRGQRLERPGRLDRLPQRPLRHPITARHRHIDLTALIEHPHDRQLLDPRLALQPHQLGPSRDQPLRRLTPQPIEMIRNVERSTIKPYGYDTYRPFREASRMAR
jgi:hypothetical protein